MILYLTLLVPLILLCNKLGLSYISKTWEALEPLSNILEFIVKLPHWMNYYNNLKDNAKNLEQKTRRLNGKAQDITSEASIAELRTFQPMKQEVRNWLETVQIVDSQVQIILEQSNREMNSLLRFFYRAWLGIRVDNKIQDVEELLQSGSSLQNVPLIRDVKLEIPYPTPKMIGIAATNNIDQILMLLKSEQISCIGIHGDQGTGKTLIVKHVYNQLLVGTNVYYAEIKENCTNQDLSTMIARRLHLELTEEDEHRRSAILHHALIRKGQFVLILDGLFKDFDPVNVGIPMRQNGGKLIFTTRSHIVCRRMCSQQTIEVQPLTHDEADELFRKELQITEYDSDEMEGIAHYIMKECGNVPGRIVEITKRLKGEHSIYVWRNTLNELPWRCP